MKTVDMVNLKLLKEAAVSLNTTGFLPKKIVVVGNFKANILEEFVKNIDALATDKQKKLPKDVKEMYNFLIEDEVTEVVTAAPAPSEEKVLADTPADTPADATQEPDKETPAPAADKETPAPAAGKSKKAAGKKKEEAGTAKPDCDAFGISQDVATKECKFCKDQHPVDFLACSKAVSEKAKKDAANKAGKYTRAQSCVDALRMGPALIEAVAKRSDDLYIEHGKSGNIKEAKWVNRIALNLLESIGVVTVDDKGLIHLDKQYIPQA